MLTFTSDFGLDDPYVAESKAAVLATCARYPETWTPPCLVDLSHAVPPGDVAAAGWLLTRTTPRFPAGSVHLAVVDPGVGTARSAVALRAGGHLYVGPGNGLFAGLAAADDLAVVRLDRPGYRLGGEEPSSTFHGRDVFAPVAAHLALGVPLAQVGSPGAADDLGHTPVTAPLPDGALGRVMWIDRFGNAISDIARDSRLGRRLDPGARLRLGDAVADGPRPTFGTAPPGVPFWYWGSGGDLELAVKDAPGAALWHWRPGLDLFEVLS